jgi:acyl-coenzyme A thioesterase PaaI-like protein
MDISQLPFNQLIGLELAGPEDGFLVSLPDKPQYSNHLGTVHGSALLAVAEAGSGEFLLRHLGPIEGFVPVVRRVEAKFRKPASGRVSSQCSIAEEVIVAWSSELASRGRLSASIPIEVVDSRGVVVMSAVVEWFISRGHVDA